MKARIHRGAVEVGGSCVELQAGDGYRLVLDLGLPLAAGLDDAVALPAIEGLGSGGDPSFLGIILSHSHPDHYGLIEQIDRGVPLYMGAATNRILKEARFFTPLGLDRPVARELRDRTPIAVGPFTVTPYLVDHSAFDSYALLIEADGRRLLYSGDFRGHGRKVATFERILDRPPRRLDALLLEGTSIGRLTRDRLSETEVEAECAARFEATDGMALACYSPQNVDRLVSVYKAAIRARRQLILDLYGASIAAATGLPSIPRPGWGEVRVYVPNSQRVRVKESEEFRRVEELGDSRILAEELAADPSRWVMSFRTSMAAELARAGCLTGARAVWMMWDGYLAGDAGHRTQSVFDRLGIELEVVHVSGHASISDLQRFAAALDATRVIPIHTDRPELYASLFENVDVRRDKDWWEV